MGPGSKLGSGIRVDSVRFLQKMLRANSEGRRTKFKPPARRLAARAFRLRTFSSGGDPLWLLASIADTVAGRSMCVSKILRFLTWRGEDSSSASSSSSGNCSRCFVGVFGCATRARWSCWWRSLQLLVGEMRAGWFRSRLRSSMTGKRVAPDRLSTLCFRKPRCRLSCRLTRLLLRLLMMGGASIRLLVAIVVVIVLIVVTNVGIWTILLRFPLCVFVWIELYSAAVGTN